MHRSVQLPHHLYDRKLPTKGTVHSTCGSARMHFILRFDNSARDSSPGWPRNLNLASSPGFFHLSRLLRHSTPFPLFPHLLGTCRVAIDTQIRKPQKQLIFCRHTCAFQCRVMVILAVCSGYWLFRVDVIAFGIGRFGRMSWRPRAQGRCSRRYSSTSRGIRIDGVLVWL